MKRTARYLLALSLVGAVAVVAGACHAVEDLTASKVGFYESKCHPGIYLTAPPPNESAACQWTYVSHRDRRRGIELKVLP